MVDFCRPSHIYVNSISSLVIAQFVIAVPCILLHGKHLRSWYLEELAVSVLAMKTHTINNQLGM